MMIGDSAELARSFSLEDVAAYVALGGAPAGGGAVPEPMIAALFSYLLGVKLPGPGTNYLKQSLHFESVAHAGEELTARATISRLRPEKALVDLETVCLGESGARVCTGRALVRVRDVNAA